MDIYIYIYIYAYIYIHMYIYIIYIYIYIYILIHKLFCFLLQGLNFALSLKILVFKKGFAHKLLNLVFEKWLDGEASFVLVKYWNQANMVALGLLTDILKCKVLWDYSYILKTSSGATRISLLLVFTKTGVLLWILVSQAFPGSPISMS